MNVLQQVQSVRREMEKKCVATEIVAIDSKMTFQELFDTLKDVERELFAIGRFARYAVVEDRMRSAMDDDQRNSTTKGEVD